MSLTWGIVLLLLLVVLSAFFSASETALTSMGRARLEYLIKAHPRKGKALRPYLSAAQAGLVATVLVTLYLLALWMKG